jgi:hypothetical protein
VYFIFKIKIKKMKYFIKRIKDFHTILIVVEYNNPVEEEDDFFSSIHYIINLKLRYNAKTYFCYTK